MPILSKNSYSYHNLSRPPIPQKFKNGNLPNLSNGYIERAIEFNTQKTTIEKLCEAKLELIEISKKYFNDVKETDNSDLVEIYRLKSLIFKNKVTSNYILDNVIQNFKIHKKQEKLVQNDTNDEKIISLSAQKYEILSVRVLDEQQQKLSMKIKKSRSHAILKQNFNFK